MGINMKKVKEIKLEDLITVVKEQKRKITIPEFMEIFNTTEYSIRRPLKDKKDRLKLQNLMYYYHNKDKECQIINLISEGLTRTEIKSEIKYSGNIKNFVDITIQKLIVNNKIERNCKVCNSIIKNIEGEFVFCSRKCSNIYSSNYNKTLKNKNISMGLNNFYKDKQTKSKARKEFKYLLETDEQFAKEYRDKVHKNRSNASKRNVLKRIENGTFVGWKSRKKESYAETFWREVLDKNNISYIKEYKILKKDLDPSLKSFYFLDFYIEVNNFKVDLEIDGKQHNYPERQESDKVRDFLLKSNDFIVYRIPWVNPKNDMNKKIVNRQINNLINFLLILYL